MPSAEDRLVLIVIDAHAGVVTAQTRLDDALAQRRAAVLALRGAGWSLQRIADHIDLTKTAVANICR
jgi:DNA-binding NarL/FixJ family response regulator